MSHMSNGGWGGFPGALTVQPGLQAAEPTRGGKERTQTEGQRGTERKGVHVRSGVRRK